MEEASEVAAAVLSGGQPDEKTRYRGLPTTAL